MTEEAVGVVALIGTLEVLGVVRPVLPFAGLTPVVAKQLAI